MAGSTSKKIVAVRFDREPVQGFVSPQTYLQDAGVEILTAAGSVVTLPYSELKAVCFVWDFESLPVWKQNRTFQSRPKTAGLWLRIAFRDGDVLEGIAPNNLALIEHYGWTVTPADAGLQNQRIFVPRTAVTEVSVMGVVGSPLRRKARPKPPVEQLKIFD